LFAKYTLKPGKRTEFNNVLLNGLTIIDKEEQGTLSIVLIADETDENVTFVMERFDGQAGLEGHMNGTAAKEVHEKLGDWVESREGGFFKEVAGFLSKDE
jgi:quinol monooxygenase YgiN